MPHEQTRWLDEALDQIPTDLTADGDGTTHRVIVAEYLRPLLRRCRATTRSRFWQWLRLQLAKSEDFCHYLAWVREGRCPLEVKTSSTEANGGFQYVVNGETALISVGDAGTFAVWRVPASCLGWALSLHPVKLKRLPPVESPEQAEIRRLKRQIKTRRPFLTPGQLSALEQKIERLEAADRRAYTPVPRYQLVKYADGRENPVHRLYLDAGAADEVDAVDGDFLNFTTTNVRVTVEPVVESGWTIAKGDRRPKTWSEEVTVQNLQITNNADAQKGFERSQLQVKTTPQGDIKTTLKIQPNADLGARTGVEGGRVMDCGPFNPLTPEERIEFGLQGTEVRPADEADRLRRKWRLPRSIPGIRWG
jgi:hypothetical protein